MLHGASESWVDVFVDDNRVQFRREDKYLGMGTYETEEAIREDLADDQVRSATIGPAGERRALCECNQRRTPGWKDWSRRHMEARKLKALSVRGTQVSAWQTPPHSKISFTAIEAAQGPDTAKYRILGTVTNVLSMNKLGLPRRATTRRVSLSSPSTSAASISRSTTR